jgi:hypothetical protein
MKIVKSLFLGSAAGLVAVSGTQAADLPVKAKPVEYVRICSLYGEGFYYIPGTDVCLRVGGYVRADWGWNVSNGSMAPTYTGARASMDRSAIPYVSRARAEAAFDSRTETAYGTLRTYMTLRIENADGVSAASNPRAFIQWAGFTLGRTKSLADIPGTPADDGFRSLHQNQNLSDTAAAGTNLVAYTWELGNGMALNIGAEDRRVKAIANLSNNVITVGTTPGTAFGPFEHPNPFINFVVNQAWGRFGVSAYFNKVNATYYNNAPAVLATSDSGSTQGTNFVAAVPGTGCPTGAQAGTSQCDHPDDKWGWAVLSGIDIKAPWAGPGDHFGGFFQYGQGAAAYSGGSNLGSPGLFGANNTVALGVITDGVFVNGGQFQLTTAWGAGGGYEHFWLPNVSTAVYGTYTQVRYNDNVINSRLFCNGAGANVVNQNIRGIAANVSCDPGFNYWTVGMVSNWFPVAGFRLAVDVLYTRIETAFEGQTVSLAKTTGLRPTGVYTAKDLGNLSVVFRAQRSFATE